MAQAVKGTRIVVKDNDKGGPEKLLVQEFDVPQPNDDQVLIQVHGAGVNFIDTYHRSGLYPNVTEIGKEGSGTVTAIGKNVQGFAKNDKVCWYNIQGSYSTHVVSHPNELLKIPSNLTENDSKSSNDNDNNTSLMDIAASIPLQALTAHYLCTSVYKVSDKDTVLVHAGAGGTGGLLIQMCKILGCKNIITTVSTDAKAKIAKENGADHIIIYENHTFIEKLKEITKNNLCNVVYDGVGLKTYKESILSVKPRGMIAFFGNASGAVPPIDPLTLTKQGSIFMTRPSLFHFVADENEKKQRVNDVFNWIKSGKLKIRIGMKFDLKDAKKAHEALEGRLTTGKIVLSPKL